MIWLLVGYMWIFIHRPFEVWEWLGFLQLERAYMVTTLVYWALFARKTFIPCRSHLPVGVLALTFLVASQISPHATFASVEDWFKMFVLYFLIVTSVREERELQLLVIGFVASIGLYELHSLREYFNGKGDYAMGTWRMVGVDVTMRDPNTFGATIIYALPFLLPAWTLARQNWQRLTIIGIGLLSVWCILLTGSRSAFVGLLFLVVAASLFSKYRWRLLPILLLIPPIIFVSLRPDLQDRYLSMFDSSKGVGGAQKSAEGRLKSFWDGMESFAENPLTGSGMGYYKAETGFATHNLYNQAMGELGIGGLIVLMGFAWAFFGDFRQARRLYYDTEDEEAESLFLYRICIAALLCCILLFLLGWGSHNLKRYNWLWFGAFSGIAVHFLKHRHDFTVAEPTSSKNSPNDALDDTIDE